MARIPLGDWGNVVARPVERPAGDATAYGAGIGKTLQTAGTIGMNDAAQQIAHDQAQETQRQQQAAREQARAAREAQDGADRVMTVRALNSLQNDARDLGDEVARAVASGELRPDQAAQHYDNRAAKILEERVQGMPPELAEYVKAQTIAPIGLARNRVIDGVAAFHQNRLQGELVQTTEELERSALADRPRAVEIYSMMMRTRGPQAGLAPDKIEANIAAFKERAAFISAGQVIRAARETPQDLDAADARLHSAEFADLSPDKLGQLENQVLARRQFLESKRQTAIVRAEAEASRRERQAQTAITVMQNFIDNGGAPDQASVAKASAMVAGTAHAPILRDLLQTASQNASFAQLNPLEQEQTILAMRAKASAQGSNPAMERRIENLERIRAQSKKQLTEDPLLWGVNRRLIETAPMQFSNLDELTAQLAQRSAAANLVTAKTGVPASPLFASEAARAADMLAALPLAQKKQAIVALAKRLDPGQVQALGAQIGGKDSVLGSALFAAGNLSPAIAEKMLRGDDALRSGRLKSAADAPAAAMDHASIARELDKVTWPTVKARDAAVRAAQYVYDGERDRNGGSANWRAAVADVTNGLADWAGSKVPLPSGMDARQFTRALQGMDAKSLQQQAGGPVVSVGGVSVPVEKLAANMGAVKLVPAGQGRYALDSGGHMVLDSRGKLLRITVRPAP